MDYKVSRAIHLGPSLHLPVAVEAALGQVLDMSLGLVLGFLEQSNHVILLVLISVRFRPDILHVLARPVVDLEHEHTSVQVVQILCDNERIPVVHKALKLNIHVGDQRVSVDPENPVVVVSAEFVEQDLDLGPGRYEAILCDFVKVRSEVVSEFVTASVTCMVFPTVVV